MGIGRTITHNLKLASDTARIFRTRKQFAALRADALKLKAGILIGKNIAKKLALPNLYRENFDLKRTNERIGKALFSAEIENNVSLEKGNLIAIKGNKIDWADGATEEQKSKTTLGTQVFKALRKKLPDSIFTEKKPDGTVNKDYYIKLLDKDPSVFKARTWLRPLAEWRAHGSLAGYKLQENLIEEVKKDMNEELLTENFQDFEGDIVLDNDTIKVLISDAHMGGGGRADDFAARKKDFIKLITLIKTKIIPEAEQNEKKVALIMIGDMAERWQFEWDAIYRENKDLAEMLLDMGIDIYYIVGNHDMDVGAFANKKIVREGGSTVYVTDMVRDENSVYVHGHGADPFNKTLEEQDISKKPFGAYITWLAKFLEKIDPNIDEKFEAVKKAVTTGKVKKAYVKHFIDYINELKQKYFDGPIGNFMPVLGHTHDFDAGNRNTDIGKKLKGSDITYYNTGTVGVKSPITWGIKIGDKVTIISGVEFPGNIP